MALTICESPPAASLLVAPLLVAPVGCTFEQPSSKAKATLKTAAAT
jgi:hypothetical protein